MIDGLRERLADLERRELAGVALMAVLVVTGAVFWYVRSLPSEVRIEGLGGGAPRPAPVASQPPSSGAPPHAGAHQLFVHVAGWVRRPGVYEFPPGARVIDAIQRAGGARDGADLTSINLAALLTDAQQIVVPRAVGPPGVPGAPGVPTAVAPTSGSGEPLVNLNTGTLEELETLPGIGETLAQRIVDHREQNGPFATVEDLLDVSGIGEQRLEDLRSKVTV